MKQDYTDIPLATLPLPKSYPINFSPHLRGFLFPRGADAVGRVIKYFAGKRRHAFQHFLGISKKTGVIRLEYAPGRTRQKGLHGVQKIRRYHPAFVMTGFGPRVGEINVYLLHRLTLRLEALQNPRQAPRCVSSQYGDVRFVLKALPKVFLQRHTNLKQEKIRLRFLLHELRRKFSLCRANIYDDGMFVPKTIKGNHITDAQWIDMVANATGFLWGVHGRQRGNYFPRPRNKPAITPAPNPLIAPPANHKDAKSRGKSFIYE